MARNRSSCSTWYGSERLTDLSRRKLHFSLPAVIEFNSTVVAARLAELSDVLGGPDSATAVRRLNSMLGIAPRLRDYGVPEGALEMLAAKAFEDGCHRLNPRHCSEADLLHLYRQAW